MMMDTVFFNIIIIILPSFAASSVLYKKTWLALGLLGGAEI